MPLYLEEAITCVDGRGERYEVEIWQERSQSKSMDGPHRRIDGLRQAFVVDPPPKRRLNAIEGGAAFRIVGEDTILRPVGDL